MRTCLNAQREIWEAVDGRDRAGARRASRSSWRTWGRPASCARAWCGRAAPRASHFCGVPVWRSFPDVERVDLKRRAARTAAARARRAARADRRPDRHLARARPLHRRQQPRIRTSCAGSDRVWVFEKKGEPAALDRVPDRRVRRRDRPLRAPLHAASTRGCSAPGSRTSRSSRNIEAGLKVNTRGSKKKSLRGSDEEGWHTDARGPGRPRPRSSPTRRTGASRGCRSCRSSLRKT